MYLLFFFIFLIALICMLINHRRKKRIIHKVRTMPKEEKCLLINKLIEPFGYCYVSSQDIFSSTIDAWQRKFGYTRRYDRLAPRFNMVFDSEPVYFDYNGRTWLIEFWKGQYGINTGAEIGIYCADKLVPPAKRQTELFHTVSNKEVPFFSIDLKKKKKTIATLSAPHWWLTVFRMGCFSNPKELSAEFCITFPDRGMRTAFVNALNELGYCVCPIRTCGCPTCFHFTLPITPPPKTLFYRFIRWYSQKKNHFFCRLFLLVTRPFTCALDQLLYLYFYLPPVFRHCLRLRRYQKKPCKRSRK